MRRRVTLTVLALVAWVAGSALGARAPYPTAAHAEAGIVLGKAHASYTPTLSGNKPVVVLAVGSGARQGESVLHSLADSLHLIFLNPVKRRATLVGIPRDSYVPIPGHGTGKINSSMFYGGPSLLVSTIEGFSGVRIDYYAITTFWGFTDMVDEVGGLTMNVPFSMNDPYSHSRFQPGLQKLGGRAALAFSRDRHSLKQGDFGRQENGGRLIIAALAQFQKEYRRDPSRLFTWLGAGMRNVDTDLRLDEVARLAFTASKVPASNVQNVVLPGRAGLAGSLSVVFLDSARKAAMFADVKVDAILNQRNIPRSPTAGEG